MSSVESLDQIIEAVRQLPEKQRELLLKEIHALPKPQEARVVAQRLRGKHRMGEKKRKRMSELLARATDGSLTAAEKEELHRLVEEFETKTLELAQAIAGTLKPARVVS